MSVRTCLIALGILAMSVAVSGCNDYSPDGVVRTAGWALKNGNVEVFRRCFMGEKLEQLEEFGMRDYIVLHQQDVNLHAWSVGAAHRLSGPGTRVRNNSQILQNFSVNVTDDHTNEFLFTAFVQCPIVSVRRQPRSGTFAASYDDCRIYQIQWSH